ncbi:MAG: PASTA domain-containing protein, partial [Sedimentisphaerales bacterium]|nr:PASTA domain-containing protein [Sedimentisphaerales bacterium]
TATYFKGDIDNVMLFNKALSEDEIAGLYNSGSGTEDMPAPVVDMTVSLGRPVVPDVTGMTPADANTAILAVDNLQVGSITYDYNDYVAAGLVISQNPTGGTEVDTGSSVDFVVSLGQSPSDDFDDNKRGAMWLVFEEQNTAIDEDVNRLNVSAIQQIDLMPSCVGHWKLNDNYDTRIVLDSSMADNNGISARDVDLIATTGYINGAFNLNGTSDYVAITDMIGTGSYTKAAWINLKSATTTNNQNILSGEPSQAFWAPNLYGNRLSAGHNGIWNQVQDPNALLNNVWYFVAVTYDSITNTLVLYKNGVIVDTGNTNIPNSLNELSIGRYNSSSTYLKGIIDNVMLFNKALDEDEIAALYNGGSGTEDMPAPVSGNSEFSANGWSIDANENFQAEVDFYYNAVSSPPAWIGLTIEKDIDNYISILAGADNSTPRFWYEQVVNGGVISSGQILRTSDTGTLYMSYDATVDKVYLSYTGYGAANAWQTITGLLAGQWNFESVKVVLGGGSDGGSIDNSQAYLDNFEFTSGRVLGWPPITDLDESGFIDWGDILVIGENWLATGPNTPGDIHKDENNIVNFKDFADFGLVW